MAEFIKNQWRAMNMRYRLLAIALLILIGSVYLLAGEFRISHAEHGKGHFKLKFNTHKGTNIYVQVWAAASLTGPWQALDLDWGQDGAQTWVDPASLDSQQRFYRVSQCSLTNPGDADNDGIDDVFEMRHPHLNPLNESDALKDFDRDGLLNLNEYQFEKARGYPKIVLDAVSLSFDAFSPAITSLVISAQYRIRPTDGLVGAAQGKNNKSFCIRQTIEITDASGQTVRTLRQDLPIDPSGIKNAAEYVIIPFIAAWDGNNEQGRQVDDGSYTYRVTGIYLRKNESGKGHVASKEKEIAVSDTLQGTVLLDATCPQIISFTPGDGESIKDPRQRLKIVFQDALSGIDPENVVLKLDWADVNSQGNCNRNKCHLRAFDRPV